MKASSLIAAIAAAAIAVLGVGPSSLAASPGATVEGADASVLVPDLPPERKSLSDAEQKRAQAAYQKAQEFVAKGELDGALYAANTAHQLVGNASTAMVKAYILELMKQDEAAFASYLAVLDLGPTKEELARASSRLKTLGLALSPPRGWVVLVVEPSEATVEIGGERFQGSRSLGISGGRHPLAISAPGHVAFSGAIEVSRGVGQRLLYNLPKIATPAVSSQAKVADSGGTFGAGVGVLVTGLVLAVAGGGTHFWAHDRGAESIRLAQPGTDGLSQNDRRLAHESATNDAELGRVLTGVLYGVGGALVVTGAILMAIDDSGSPAGQGGVDVSLRGAIGTTSWVGLGGSF